MVIGSIFGFELLRIEIAVQASLHEPKFRNGPERGRERKNKRSFGVVDRETMGEEQGGVGRNHRRYLHVASVRG